MSNVDLERLISQKVTNMAFACALMVVVMHVWCDASRGSLCWWVNALAAQGICRIAVPFFFLASGYFLGRRIGEPNWYWTAIRKRLVTVGIPYVFWNVVAFFFFGVVYYCCTSQIRFERSGILQNLLYMIGLDVSSYPPLYPLWFLRTLLVWFGLSFVFQLLGSRKDRWAIFLVLIAALGMLPMFPIQGLSKSFFLDLVSLSGAAYFPLGVCLSRIGWGGFVPRRIGIVGLVLGGSLFVGKMFCVLSDRLVCSSLLERAAIPLCLAGLWRLMPSETSDCLKPVVGLSFPIYIVHVFLFKVFELSMNVLGVGEALRISTSGFILRAVALCALSIAVARLICLGRFGQIIFGGRGNFAVQK